MKYFRLILTTILLLNGPLACWSQNIGGGLSIGGIASQIDGDQWAGYNKVGYHIGGYAFYDLSDKVALQIEILHTNRGSREVNKAYGQIHLNYIDVPLLLRFGLLETDNARILGEIGPSINMLLSAKNGFKPLTADRTDLYHRFSGEFHFGSTLLFTENLGLFARWSVSFTNLLRSYPPWFTIHYFTIGGRINFK
ncbi:MAG TPA: PorT family protein [Bacteroidetes bacterium]|nr:PorT family protein [Bacteroidota bacterium]